jgi:hypothetical protein
LSSSSLAKNQGRQTVALQNEIHLCAGCVGSLNKSIKKRLTAMNQSGESKIPRESLVTTVALGYKNCNTLPGWRAGSSGGREPCRHEPESQQDVRGQGDLEKRDWTTV